MKRTTSMLLAAAVLALAIASPSPAAPAAAAGPRDRRAAAVAVGEVLAGRIDDPAAAERLRRKLLHLNAREYRLAVALCERIEQGGRSAGAEIAFSLLTALLVLS